MTMATPTPSVDAAARARAEWRRFGMRVSSITPKNLGMGILTVVVGVAAAALIIGTWPATLPFAIGGALAYALLPVVNALDRVMPRVLAAILGLLLVLAMIVAVFAIVIPPLANGIAAAADELPTRAEISAWIADLEATLGEAEGPIGPTIAAGLESVVQAVRSGIGSSSDGLNELGPAILQGAIGAISVILGLIVLPAWILTVVRDQRAGRHVVYTSMPGWLRDDAWAVIRIVDRSAGTYLRGGVPHGIVTGLTMWVAFEAIDRLGFATITQAGPVAVLAGAVQVIPEIGPLIGFLPALLLLPVSIERAAMYLVVYVASRWVAGTLLGSMYAGRRRLHPAIMVPGIVALSQFGLLWLFLAGPVLAIGFDLVRYFHGRLSEPSRPAGVIPDEVPQPGTASAGAVAPTPARTVPWSTQVTSRG